MKHRIVTDVPGPKTRELMSRASLDMQAHYRTLMFDDRASEGCYLVDVDGNRFLDLFANFALGALGYNHPSHRAVVTSEAYRCAAINASSTPFIAAEQWVRFLESLEKHALPADMTKVFCVDAGGEGVESALKAAFIVHAEDRRESAGLPRDPLQCDQATLDAWLDNHGTDAVVISFSGAFHGRGLGPLSATHSKAIHKADLPAFPWPQVPFPALQFPLDEFAKSNLAAEEEALASLDRVLAEHAGRVAAVLVEPIQSEGGDRHARPEFFQRVAERTADAGAAMVFDEVQTGVGATGTMWCHQQLGLERAPDMVTFGKKMQLGGFFAKPRFDLTQFGRMYQTRNGDRARAMIAQATLETIHRDSLLDHVRSCGQYFLDQLRKLQGAQPDLLEQVRGRGFLLAFDMPSVAVRNDFIARCMRRGVLVSYTGVRSVRLRPHLITTTAHVDEAVEVFSEVLAELR